jgi:hypothetical protein
MSNSTPARPCVFVTPGASAPSTGARNRSNIRCWQSWDPNPWATSSMASTSGEIHVAAKSA